MLWDVFLLPTFHKPKLTKNPLKINAIYSQRVYNACPNYSGIPGGRCRFIILSLMFSTSLDDKVRITWQMLSAMPVGEPLSSINPILAELNPNSYIRAYRSVTLVISSFTSRFRTSSGTV